MRALLSEPDTLVSEQFMRIFVSRQQMPERRLFAAVLMEAVADFRDALESTEKREAWAFQELLAWFSSRDRRWPFSFENLCEQLDLDPGCVRRHLTVQLNGKREAAH